MANNITQSTQESVKSNDIVLPTQDTAEYFDILNAVIQDVQRSNQLYENDFKERNHIMERLTHALTKFLPTSGSPKSRALESVGSMTTDLSTKKSDLNFTLKPVSKHNRLRYQENRAKLMDELKDNWTKDPMISAYFYDLRVSETDGNPKYRPVLKFKDVQTRLCCNLSSDDVIGEHASKLISAYIKWDERFQVLGHSMKHLTKVCKIDRSIEGGLSNYAYTIMVIYFLQKTMPPVLPVLQAMHAGQKPEKMVDGCNVWFFEEEEPGSHATPNSKSVGHLWLDMLRFYGVDFDCRNVVSIDSWAVIPSDKTSLVVLDPFDRGNDLCRDLEDQASSHVMQVFKKAFERFRTLPGYSWTGQIKEYFFNHDALVGSDAQELQHKSELSKSKHPDLGQRGRGRQRPCGRN